MANEPLRHFLKRIESLRLDAIHGAAWLTRAAVGILSDAADAGLRDRELTTLAIEAARSRPMMASIFRLADRFVKSLERGENPKRFLEEFSEITKRKAAAALRHGVRIVPEGGSVMLHSHSSLVADTLLQAHSEGKRFRAICTESRPKNEGVDLAGRLCDAGIETTLIVDAAAGEALKRCDALWLGCDGLGSFGLVHKIGTFPMAAAAKRLGVEVTVLGTGDKFWPLASPMPQEPPKRGEELGHPGCFEVWNRYFDVTPIDLLSNCISEEGKMRVKEALERFGGDAAHPKLQEAFQRSIS